MLDGSSSPRLIYSSMNEQIKNWFRVVPFIATQYMLYCERVLQILEKRRESHTKSIEIYSQIRTNTHTIDFLSPVRLRCRRSRCFFSLFLFPFRFPLVSLSFPFCFWVDWRFLKRVTTIYEGRKQCCGSESNILLSRIRIVCGLKNWQQQKTWFGHGFGDEFGSTRIRIRSPWRSVKLFAYGYNPMIWAYTVEN